MSADPIARATELAALGELAAVCTKCALAEGRTQVVFGTGDPDADVFIVGEAPGQREDEQGEPFVGPSGKLLDQLLEEVGFTRPDVYIANVVKCRPPRNRDPRPEEIDACKGYLRTQLRLVDPKVVLTLGNFSAKLLLRTTTGITRLRGVAFEWWGRYLVASFHPAAALRGSARVLEDMREDFALVRRVVDGHMEPPAAPPAPDLGPGDAPAPSAETVSDPIQMGLFG